MRLPGAKKLSSSKDDKDVRYALSSDVLKEIAGKGYEIASLILLWRFYTKLSSTYVDLLAEEAEQARISKKLVLLEDHVPLEVPLAALTVHEPDHDKLVAFLKEQTFRSILARVESQAGAKPAAPQARTVTGAASSAPEALRAPSAHIPAAPLGQNYELVQSEEALAPWIARALAAGIVAVDTETTSLDATQARLVGVSLSLEPGEARGACEACYVPLGHKAPQHQGTLDLGENAAREAPKQMELKRALEMLKPLLEDPTVLKIGHNIKYDMVVLARYGIAIAPIDDTMLISLRARGGPPRARHGRARQAPPRSRYHQVQGRDRQREGPDRLRRGRPRQGLRVCRRGCRRDAQAVAGTQAPAPGRAPGERSTRRSSGRSCR